MLIFWNSSTLFRLMLWLWPSSRFRTGLVVSGTVVLGSRCSSRSSTILRFDRSTDRLQRLLSTLRDITYDMGYSDGCLRFSGTGFWPLMMDVMAKITTDCFVRTTSGLMRG